MTAANQHVQTTSGTWQQEAPGVERMQLAVNVGSTGEGDLGHDVSLVRLEPGTTLPSPPADHGIELVVIAGTLQLPAGTLTKNGYARRPPTATGSTTTTTAAGATLLVRTGAFAASDREIVHKNSSEQPWLQGQGNLRVQPLHSIGDAGSAMVYWPAGERFQPHRHWGGEEIFVLSGTFEDEHGRYQAGTWMLSPHLSAHHPFVTEETIIFVKTGHLPQLPVS